MNTHTRSSQYFNIGRERAPLTEELPAAASCWEKENLFQRVLIPMQRQAALTRLSEFYFKGKT